VGHPNHVDAPASASPCVAFSPDGKILATASADKTIRLWDPFTAKELGQFQADGSIQSIAFSPDGKTLVSGSADTTVIVWDIMNPVKSPGDAKKNVILIGDSKKP